MPELPPMSHYDVLGVTSDARFADIRAAYLRLVKIYHPDRAPRAKAAAALQLFQAITAAYATLRDPMARRDYDRSLRTGEPAPMPLNDNQDMRKDRAFWSRIFGSFL